MSLTCSTCGKECKDKSGLTNHQKKCDRGEVQYICSYCSKTYSTKQVLQAHLPNCKYYSFSIKEEEYKNIIAKKEEKIRYIEHNYETLHKEYKLQRDQEFNKYEISKEREMIEYKAQRDTEFNEYKLQRDKEFNEYKLKRDTEYNQLITSKEREVSLTIQDRDKFYNEREELKEKVKKLEEANKILDRRYNDVDLERKQVSNKMITFAERASNSNSKKSVVQHIHNNQRTINIQHYNPSLIVGHIVPPNVIIYSVNGLVNHIDRLGFGNFYRMSDRSRKSILWYDEQGLEMKDSKCTLMSKKLIETLRPELQIQKAYLQQEVERIKALPASQRSQASLNELNNTILFTSSLLDQHKATMKELQDEIGKRAKNKHDTTVDMPKVKSYVHFISEVQVALMPHIKEWIGLDSKELGRYIAKKIKDHYATEGASRQEDKPYIVIKDDEECNKMVTETEFEDLWKKIIEPLVQKETVSIIEYLIEDKTDYNQQNAIKTMKWLQQVSSSLADETPHHSFKEILHSIASTN